MRSFVIASRWDFRRKTRVFRGKAAKTASNFEGICTVTHIVPYLYNIYTTVVIRQVSVV